MPVITDWKREVFRKSARIICFLRSVNYTCGASLSARSSPLSCRSFERHGGNSSAGLRTMSLKHIIFSFVSLTFGATVFAQQTGGEVPFLYPDPRTFGTQLHLIRGEPAGAVTPDRYAGVSEQERCVRMLNDWCNCNQCAHLPCPLCVEDPTTPCKTCKMCLAGFPCEKTLCRHCVQPRSKDMGNSCDLTAGDEPCGTCDACREHRSDPCEHADDGYGPRGEFNPYREPRLLSVIPRPILDTYNNGARKFPVYYNPAPYYRPTWNPSLFAGYARPYTFRWSCGLCFRDPCGCNAPGMAGQVPYAYTCKFCNRNPCACTQDICNVTKPMDPIGTANALSAMKAEPGSGGARPVEIRGSSPSTSPTSTPSSGSGIRVGDLLDDDLPTPPEPSHAPTLP